MWLISVNLRVTSLIMRNSLPVMTFLRFVESIIIDPSAIQYQVRVIVRLSHCCCFSLSF